MNTETTDFINDDQTSIWKLFWTFLKIGSTAFGGFMALISVVQNYLVDREKIISKEDMLDGISLATILPGPVAVNVVAYAGYRIRGIPGAITCATAVTLPSFFLILILSYVYFEYGSIPSINNIFLGFMPAVIAIIIAAAFNMGKKTLTGKIEQGIALVSLTVLVLVYVFLPEYKFPTTLGVIFTSGLTGWFVFRNPDNTEKNHITPQKTVEHSAAFRKKIIISGIILSLLAVAFFNTQFFPASKLFTTFAGMSLLLFGGGFVFIPLIQDTVVQGHQWVSHKEFVDAIAMGQITPGPILISATFIGYKVAGITGAITATIGIFAPPAVLMLICTHYLTKLKSSKTLQAILKGVRCAVIGMIASAAYAVSMIADINYITISIFILSLFALMKLRLEVAWIIPAAGLTTFLAYM
ncbi:Chromate transport protein ChrA [hydrothermal vent metagenome]|uniref:Chromate transport protein ChrA n=1 Tax=hydrothermal vent metagenome TaxID=652676 RepID=A0A3B0XCX2_9ZZZZ